MASKKKITTAVTAVTLAVAMAVGGTFAWQSISQTALNEASDVVNPGGRLHDDFNGENKDVYVENFAEDPIYARVRLEEYFEIITNYGKEGIEKSTPVLGSKNDDGTYNYELFTDYDSLSGDIVSAGNDTDGTSYWSWKTGGETVYMPTFDKNKDSLKADINGIYEDGNVGTISNRVLDINAEDAQYSEYKEYTAGEEKTAEATYDADSNSAEDGSVITVEETHTAKPTGSATLISMADWLAMNGVFVTAADDPYGVAPAFAANATAVLHYDKNADDAAGTIADVEEPWDTLLTLSDGTGFTRDGYTLVGWNTAADGNGDNYALGAIDWRLPEGETTLYAVWDLDDGVDDDQQQEPQSQDGYWVYDTDGWVYWSQPIAPDTATGLLLDGIELNQVMDDTWYYAINVVAQFVTADDVGKADGTGFYVEGTEPTAEAEALLKTIGVTSVDDEAGEDGDGEGYTETLPDINFVYGEAFATVYRGTSYTFGNVASGGFPLNTLTAAEITTAGAASYVNDDMIIVIDENEPNDTLSLAVTHNGDGGGTYTETVTLTVLDPAAPDNVDDLRDAMGNGGIINITDTIETDEDDDEVIPNFDGSTTADYVWTEGGTVNGGELVSTSGSSHTLFINNENNWPVTGDGANAATMNGTDITSGSRFAIYAQAVDAPITLNDMDITNNYGGGILAEYTHPITLNNLTVHSDSLDDDYAWVNSALAAGMGANVGIYGGSYTGTNAVYLLSSGANVTIYDGTFTGNLTVENGTLTIYGGTFTVDPTAYVDTENYKVVDNGNDTWTVEEIQRGLYTLYLKDENSGDFTNQSLLGTDGFVSKVRQAVGSTIKVEPGYTANPNWELPDGVTVGLAAYGLANDGWDEEVGSVTAEMVFTTENNPYVFNTETGALLNSSSEAIATINNDTNTITINSIVDNLIIDVYLIKDGQRIESTGSSSDVDKLFNSKYFVVSDLTEFGYIEIWKTTYDWSSDAGAWVYDYNADSKDADFKLSYDEGETFAITDNAHHWIRVYDTNGNIIPADQITVTETTAEEGALIKTPDENFDTPTYQVTMWGHDAGIEISYGGDSYTFTLSVGY